MRLLHIDSAITGAASVSRQLTASTVEQWRTVHPQLQVEHLDLVAQPVAHYNGEALALRQGQTENLSAAQERENAVTERLLAQFLAADVVVLGAPIYNFSIPTQLKAWIDRIVQPGRTFRYTAYGPEGLAGDKTVVVVSSRGGVYSDSEAARSLDFQERYLQTVLGFIGVTDVRVVRAEGLGRGADARAEALAQAQQAIGALKPAPQEPALASVA